MIQPTAANALPRVIHQPLGFRTARAIAVKNSQSQAHHEQQDWPSDDLADE
jgi:hypothetical protein